MNTHRETKKNLAKSKSDFDLYDETLTNASAAVRDGNLDKIKEIISNNAEIVNKHMDYFGASLLHIAVECGYIDIAVYLLDSGANINATNTLGQTPLHLAVVYDKLEIVKLLHEKKANINKTDVYGQTPLDTAINNYSEEIINFLKENGAKKGLELAVDRLTNMNSSENTEFSDIFKSLMTILCNPQNDRMCEKFLGQVDNLLSFLKIKGDDGADEIMERLVDNLLTCHLSKEQISTTFVACQKILEVFKQFGLDGENIGYCVITLQSALIAVMNEQYNVELNFKTVNLSLASSDLVDSGSFSTLGKSATTYCQQLVAEKKAQEELSSSSEAIPISQKNADVNSPIKTDDSSKTDNQKSVNPITYIEDVNGNRLSSSDSINRDNSNPGVRQKKVAPVSPNKESSFWSKLGKKSTITVVTALVFGAAGFVFGGPALAIVAFGFGLVAGGVAAVMAGDDPTQMSSAEAKSIFSKKNTTIQSLDEEHDTDKTFDPDAQLKNQVASTFKTFFTNEKIRQCMGDEDTSKHAFLKNTLVCYLLDVDEYDNINANHITMFRLLVDEIDMSGSVLGQDKFSIFRNCFFCLSRDIVGFIREKLNALKNPEAFIHEKFPAMHTKNSSSPINMPITQTGKEKVVASPENTDVKTEDLCVNTFTG